MTPRDSSAITVRRATVDDACMLARLAERTFRDTFSADNTPENMEAYVASAFGEVLQRAELADDRVTVFIAECDGREAGYVMLRDRPRPDMVGGDPIEVARLYAVSDYIGMGVGSCLMERCFQEAASRGRNTIWLGVWERNLRAIGFYERWGFTDVGSHHFQLGDDLQTDRVLVRSLMTSV